MKILGCALAGLLGMLMTCVLLPALLLAAVVGSDSAATGYVASGFVGANGPVYQAGTASLRGSVALEKVSIRDLGFGSSDAPRVDRMIRAINPDSPLAGQGAHILALAQKWHVDPLLIAQWQFESGMATNGINSPANGGNMTWDAAREATQLYGCTRGPASLGHVWATCPTVPAGLSLWKDYVASFYVPQKLDRFDLYVNRYNPCSDSAKYGFVCGSEYGRGILDLIRKTAGPPVSAGTAAYVVPENCPPAKRIQPSVNGVPWAKSEQGRQIDGRTVPILNTILGRTDYTNYQGFGPTDFPGEPSYAYQGRYYPLFHAGYDLNFPEDDGAPLYSPDDGVATKVVFPDSTLVEVLELPNGYTWRMLHLSRQVAEGAVRKGDLVGHIGSTGNSSGPHLHLELDAANGGRAVWLPPEQWVCRTMTLTEASR